MLVVVGATTLNIMTVITNIMMVIINIMIVITNILMINIKIMTGFLLSNCSLLFLSGDEIIQKGTEGNVFYVIKEGTAPHWP